MRKQNTKVVTRKELRKQDKLQKKARKQEHEAKRAKKQKPAVVEASKFQFDEDNAPPPPKRVAPETTAAAAKYLTKKTRLEQELDEDEMEIQMLEQKLGIRKKTDWDRAAKEFKKDGFDDEITKFLRGEDDDDSQQQQDDDGSDVEDDDGSDVEDDREGVAREEEASSSEEEEDEDSYDPLANAETTFLPKSGLYGEDAVPLTKRSTSSMKRSSSTDQGDDEVSSELRSIFNKLSTETASHCVKSLVALFEQQKYSFQQVLQALCRTVFAMSEDDDVLLPCSIVVVLDALLKGRNVLATFMEQLALNTTEVSAPFFGNLCALEACFPQICSELMELRPTERAVVQLVQTCGWRMRAADSVRFRDQVLQAAERFESNTLELHGKSKFDYKPREELCRQRKKWMMREVFLRFEHSRLPPPLQVPLQDFLQAEEKGRWWIQGASWQQQEGGAMLLKPGASNSNDDALDVALKQHKDLVPSAIKFGLKTKLKQAVFCQIMSANDYLDAFTNVMQLKLQALEERVLCQIICRLASESKTFNPFFSLLAVQLCNFNSRFKFSFQVVIWDKLKDFSVGKSTINFAKFTAELVCKFSLSLALLKNVDFVKIGQREMVEFLREFFVHLFVGGVAEGREGDLVVAKAFSRLQNVQENTKLRDGLVVFFSRTEPFLNAKKSTVLGKRVTIARRVLDHYVRDTTLMEVF